MTIKASNVELAGAITVATCAFVYEHGLKREVLVSWLPDLLTDAADNETDTELHIVAAAFQTAKEMQEELSSFTRLEADGWGSADMHLQSFVMGFIEGVKCSAVTEEEQAILEDRRELTNVAAATSIQSDDEAEAA